MAFRRSVAMWYLQHYATTPHSGAALQGVGAANTPAQHDHKAHWVIPQKKQTRCAHCHEKTTTRCEKCDFGVHVRCFKAFHNAP